MRLIASILLLSLSTGACATAPDMTPSQRLASDMEGRFEVALGTDEAMQDRRLRIDALGPGEWVYYQVNHQADLSVYRQRILQLQTLSDGRVKQTAWTFEDAEAHADLWDKPGALAALSLDDLSVGLEEGCAQVWSLSDTVWRGIVDPETCIITSSRRGTQMRIGAESVLSPTSLSVAERGFDMDRAQLWGTAPGDFYVLTRVD